MNRIQRHPSSFRDPAGFIFIYNNHYYRQVNQSCAKDYELFMEKLYPSLTAASMILTHNEVSQIGTDPDRYKTLLPDQLSFISYPHEWSFDMLKDAALLTLGIQKMAMENGMSLKDATPYNVQWHNGRMMFIDTLSFEKYDEQKPWIAYRQFCEGFLAPLALMHYARMPLQQLFIGYPEGIPLKIASALLPLRSKFKLHLYLNLHLHSKYSGNRSAQPKDNFSRKKLVNIIDSLHAAVSGLHLNENTLWGDYYGEANTRQNYVENKKQVIAKWAEELTGVSSVVDIGGNDGTFARIFADLGMKVLCADLDHQAINDLYKRQQPPYIHPLIVDFSQPTPALGFNNTERLSFHERADADLVLGLALIHHLCIGKNIPLNDVANSFARIAKNLIIEFVPKEDPKVREMLTLRKDIYLHYGQQAFEKAFTANFSIVRSVPLAGSERTLYLMERKADPEKAHTG